MRRLLKNIEALYTCDTQDRILRGAYIVVENNSFAEIGAGDPPPGDYDEIFDLDGCIAVPGLINVHHHFFQHLTRAVPRAQRGNLLDWLRLLYPVWSRVGPREIEAATKAAIAELLLTGATTTADHCYLVPNCDPAFIDSEIGAARAMGIRLHLVRGSTTSIEANLEQELTPLLGPRAGGLIDEEQSVLSDMRRTIEKYHSTSRGSFLTVAIGPTTTTFDNLNFMRDVAQLAKESDCGLHMHFHPRPDERDRVYRETGRSPLDILDDCGWLRPGTWFAHGTRLENEEISRLADEGCALAHCPRMILRLGAKITKVHRARLLGLRTGIGVDGAASNDAAAMLDEMRIALLLHRVGGGDAGVPFEEWLDPYDILLMATREGAAILGRSDIGMVKEGMLADLAVFSMRGVGYAGARFDLLSGLLLAGSEARAELTMVGGKPLVIAGQLLDQDETKIRKYTDDCALRLVEEASALTGVNYFEFPPRLSADTPSR